MSDKKKIWTYGEMKAKVMEDIDIEEEDPDEQFIRKTELIGYFNEAIQEAESEIMVLNQEYFLASQGIPLVQGQSEYSLPDNIFAKKIRGIMYENGPQIYRVRRFKMFHKFESIALAELYNEGDLYQYYILNQAPGVVTLKLIPAARETAILPPMSNTFIPMRIWYIRNANRIPYPGDFTNAEDILATSVNTTSNVITVDPLVTYVTGDAVRFTYKSGNGLPSPLAVDTTYYVIAVTDTTIKLATSAVNAAAGTAIDLTTAGTNYFTMTVAATDAIIDATLIDIPECSTFIMEWVKANCLFKDGDPRLAGSTAKMEQQRKMLQDTLAEGEPDTDDTLQGDFSLYTELS